MTEIKRYLPTIDYRYNGTTETVTAVMDQHPQGDWVRWEDVNKMLERLDTLEHDDEIRRMYTTMMGRPL